MLSRILYGTRISMTIGLIGVTLSLLLGIVLGGISGYYGGWVDNIIQRTIEFVLSLPTTPLWLGRCRHANHLAAVADLSLHHDHPFAESAGRASPASCRPLPRSGPRIS